MSRGKYGRLIMVAVCLAIIPYCFSNEIKIVSYDQTNPPVELDCSGEVPDGTKIIWKLNGTNIKNDKNWETKFTIEESNSTLRIKKVDPSTVYGPIMCSEESNNVEIKSFEIKVRAYVVPFEKPRNVIEGDPLSLECKAWGIPEPVITWQRNGTEIVSDGPKGKITFKKSAEGSGTGSKSFPSVENATVRIEAMEYDEGGIYTCIATNVVENDGSIETANATVTVNIKNKYAALWPFLGICVEVAVLCTIILIYEKRRAKRIEEEEREEEAAHLNANNDTKAPLSGDDELRQRK